MKTVRVLSLITGILLIMAGVVALQSPLANVVGLTYFLIITMIAAGIAEIIMFFFSQTRKHDWWMLISGIISLLLGIWAVLDKQKIIGISLLLPIFFAIWLLTTGVMRIIGSTRIKKFGVRAWWLFLIIGILGTLAGIYFLLNLRLSGLFLGYIVAFVFIYQGISSVVQYFMLKR